jgi:LytS/YehU family sensor histidine kinase
LYKEYEKTGDTKQALYHHVAYETEKSKLTKLERSKTVMELETKFQTQKKELQIISLSQQNHLKETQIRMREYMLFGVSALLLVIIILAIVLIRQNRMKSAHQALILEQKLLRSQMNPHFIFNTLASIQNFILQEDPDKASKYLSKFSKLVRNILDNSVEEYVTLDSEISTVENYLELQKMRYTGKFDYSLLLDEKINAEEIYLPPMLCQPFIENALEHGIKHKEGAGRIDISLNLDDRGLIFLITDNGVGRERAKEIETSQQNTHRSLATGITIDRLKILNKRSGTKITFEITDLKDDLGNALGTQVTFLFPL